MLKYRANKEIQKRVDEYGKVFEDLKFDPLEVKALAKAYYGALCNKHERQLEKLDETDPEVEVVEGAIELE